MKLTIEKETERTQQVRSSFLGTIMARRASEPDPTLPELRQKITNLVARNAVAMVQCAIDGVMEEGQYQAIKYLFEMVGIYPATAGEDDAPEDTLSKLLLRQFGIDQPKAEDGCSAGGEIQVHPVK